MGRSYWFECSKCGYRAKVSGGSDRGLHFYVHTVSCQDCKQLYDAVTRLKVSDDPRSKTMLSTWRWPESNDDRRHPANAPTFESVLNRLLFAGIKRFKWLNLKLQCPVSSSHRVQRW